MTTVGVGTAGRRKVRAVLLATQSGASISQASQTPSLLVRHEGGEFGGVPGLAHGGGMPRHPAGIWVTQFAAFGRTVSGHCHVREGANICGQVEGNSTFRQSLILIHIWTIFIEKKSLKKMAFENRNGVISITPWIPLPTLRSLQLLLSSQQQLLCSCRYALCNECYCVHSPQAGVVDARGDMLCLCHFEVSHSSLSGIFVIYHHIVNMFNSNIFLFDVIYTLRMVHQMCINTRGKKKKKANYNNHSYCNMQSSVTKGIAGSFRVKKGEKNIAEWAIDWQCWNEFPALDYHPFFIQLFLIK